MYGSSSWQNPQRVCEVLSVRCSFLPSPEHYIKELATKTSVTAIYMKKYFHNMMLLHGKLSIRLLRAKAAMDEDLLHFRHAFPGIASADELLRYLYVTDINICTVGYMRRELDKLYFTLISLSMQVERDDAAPSRQSSRDTVQLFELAEEVMVSLEKFAEIADRVEPVNTFLNIFLRRSLIFADMLFSYCLACNGKICWSRE